MHFLALSLKRIREEWKFLVISSIRSINQSLITFIIYEINENLNNRG